MSYPSWICEPCGTRYGKRVVDIQHIPPAGAKCGWCGMETVSLSAPRDFGFPKSPDMLKRDPP